MRATALEEARVSPGTRVQSKAPSEKSLRLLPPPTAISRRLPNKMVARLRAGRIAAVGTARNSRATTAKAATLRVTTATGRNGAKRARKRRIRIHLSPSWPRSRRSLKLTRRSAAKSAVTRRGPAD